MTSDLGDREGLRAFFGGYWRYAKTPQLDGFWDQNSRTWQVPTSPPRRADPQPMFWGGFRPEPPFDARSEDGVKSLYEVVKNTLHFHKPGVELWFEPGTFDWYTPTTRSPPLPPPTKCYAELLDEQRTCDRLFDAGNMNRDERNQCYEDARRRYRSCESRHDLS